MDSDRPTLRPQKIKKAVNFLEIGKALVALGSAMLTAGGVVWASYSWFTTDQELLEHNLSLQAHSPFRDELATLKKLLEDNAKQCSDSRDGAVLALRFAIRERAADREPDHRFKKLAADFYEEEFEALVRKGKPLQDAFTDSLRTTWFDRPRVR